jgi:hypothetical protein
VDTRDCGAVGGQLFLCLLSFKQNTGPGREPGAQMVVGMNNNQQVREAVNNPSHMVAAVVRDTHMSKMEVVAP